MIAQGALVWRAGVRPVMAGPVTARAGDPAFFEREMRPLLAVEQVVWVGERWPDTLDRLYRGAACMLFPIECEEPFGLAVVEAMARGVPVIATRRGSMPELIESGVSGLFVEAADKRAAPLRAVREIYRAGCFRYVAAHFNWDVTGRAYLNLILEVVRAN